MRWYTLMAAAALAATSSGCRLMGSNAGPAGCGACPPPCCGCAEHGPSDQCGPDCGCGLGECGVGPGCGGRGGVGPLASLGARCGPSTLPCGPGDSAYDFQPGPPTASVAYPYYTVKGPGDFLNPHPSGIGPGGSGSCGYGGYGGPCR